MSEVAISAEQISREAATWLERRDRDDWNEAGEHAFEAWLAQSPAHKLAYWRVRGAWSQTDRLSALRHVVAQRLAPQPPRKSWPVLRIVSVGIGTVVIAIAMIAATADLTFFASPREKTYSTGIGVRETIALPDGSQIELNTDTSVRLAEDGLHRHVTLDRGEAFFQVKHDAAHPFVVVAGNQRVIDLGTKFAVRDNVGHVEVALVEGRARIESLIGAALRQSATLAPGDVAIADGTSLKVTARPQRALADELGWRRGVLIFRRTSLAEAAEQFNRYNTHRLIVADDAVAKLQIGGTFQATNPELFVRVARDILGLRIEHHGSETVISR